MNCKPSELENLEDIQLLAFHCYFENIQLDITTNKQMLKFLFHKLYCSRRETKWIENTRFSQVHTIPLNLSNIQDYSNALSPSPISEAVFNAL